MTREKRFRRGRHPKQLEALDTHRTATQFKPIDPNSPSVRLAIRIPKGFLEQLDAAAEAAGVTRSELIRTWLQERLG